MHQRRAGQNGNQITVPKGTQTECTITNTRKTSTLKLKKIVSGGGSVPADWTLKADGPTGSPSYSKPGDHNSFEPIWANAEYTLSETAPAGQAANYSSSVWKCDKGVNVTGGKITVPAGTTDVTCEITNTRKTANIKLKKIVSGGGSVPADWTLKADGPTGSPSYSKPGDHNAFEPIWANAEYTLSETAPAGQAANYSSSVWTCDKGVNVTGGKITVPAGTTDVTCEITNTRKTANIKLKKIVSGGASVPGDWTLKADGPTGSPSYSKPGDHNAFEPIWANAEYTLSETGPGNYTASSWSCDKGVTVTGGKITVPAGTTDVTCEITNRRDLAKLAVVKKVDGGASVPADWKLSAKAAAPNADKNIVDRDGNITTLAEVYAGTEYTLSETGPGNYTAGSWQCTGTGVSQNGNKVTVAKGGEVTCEITNTRDLAKLAVVKKVDGGASVPADWKLSAKAAAPNADKNIVDRDGNITTLAEVYAGTQYTLSETGPGNYTASDWKCEDADGPVTVTGGNKVTLAKNAEVTCEITNKRDLAKLAVVKKVDGGANVPADWKLSAKAAAPNADKNIVDRDGNITTLAEVYAGTEYTLSETGPGNYTASDWKCEDADGPVTVTDGNKVTLDKNAEVTCEITNTRDAAELKLLKKVTGDNGDKAPGDWDLTATAAAPNDGKNFTVDGDADTFNSVFAGTQYTLSETGPGNYTASDWKCEDADGPDRCHRRQQGDGGHRYQGHL